MNHKSRTKNSFKNIKNGLISQIVSLVFNFIVRTIFVKYLSKEYLGINGLFTNILSILSLAELGFGVAIVYSLYAPLAKNDIKKIQAIMNFYKKVYMYIGIIIGILGICIIPFMDYIIKDNLYLNNLNYIYILF
ncbi:sugar translocase, partial [Clostridium perfringens]